ncbi:MAG: ParA family protein [Porticoccaceae bacterium]
MRAIAVINQKGGVGKTTTTANLAHGLALMGKRVMAIDLDPQSHLAAHLGLFERGQPGIDELMLGRVDVGEVDVIDARDNLKLIPAGANLGLVERGTGDGLPGERLRELVQSYKDRCDFVLIDCPPASGLLIDYALTAVDETIVPVAGDYLALRGLSDLIATLRDFEEKHDLVSFNQWLVVTRFHTRRRLSWEVRDTLISYFPERVLATPIRETSVLAECPGFGKTAFEYKRGNHGEADYGALARNFVNEEYADER